MTTDSLKNYWSITALIWKAYFRLRYLEGDIILKKIQIYQIHNNKNYNFCKCEPAKSFKQLSRTALSILIQFHPHAISKIRSAKKLLPSLYCKISALLERLFNLLFYFIPKYLHTYLHLYTYICMFICIRTYIYFWQAVSNNFKSIFTFALCIYILAVNNERENKKITVSLTKENRKDNYCKNKEI